MYAHKRCKCETIDIPNVMLWIFRTMKNSIEMKYETLKGWFVEIMHINKKPLYEPIITVRNGTPYISLTCGNTTSLEIYFVKRSFKVHFGIRRFSFCKANSFCGWSSLCKKLSSYISSVLFSNSLCKFITNVSLHRSSPTLIAFSSTFIFSLDLHCIYAFVHNHHPMIDNVAKFFSRFFNMFS
jgi:hypothetical protein